MSETETILKVESGVKAYEGEHPPSVGLKAGAFADVGTIILTNQRFVYVNKGGAARAAVYALGGALAARATEKSVSKAELDDVASYPGSYSIPIQNITRVETARHFGSSYLRIDNNYSTIKPAHSFILGSGLSMNEDWVAAINSTIMTMRSQPPQTNSPSCAIQCQHILLLRPQFFQIQIIPLNHPSQFSRQASLWLIALRVEPLSIRRQNFAVAVEPHLSLLNQSMYPNLNLNSAVIVDRRSVPLLASVSLVDQK